MKFAPKLALTYLLVVLTALLIAVFFVVKSIETYGLKSMEEELLDKNNASQSYIRQQVFLQAGNNTENLWSSLTNPITGNSK